jgi:hypothetical protein
MNGHEERRVDARRQSTSPDGISQETRWDEVQGGDPTYDPAGPPTASTQDTVPYEGPVETSYDPRVEDPYYGTYGNQAYRFAPPPPQYAYPPPYAYPYPYPRPVKPSNPMLPVAGGILVIISGIISILWMAIIWGGPDFFWFWGGQTICLIIGFLFPVIAIIGGMFAVMRRAFPIALIGAILSMLSSGLFGVSLLLGLIGLILIALGHDTFRPMTQAPIRQY